MVAISGDFDGIKLNAFVMIWGEVSTGKRWKVIDMTLSRYIMFDAHAADAHCWDKWVGCGTENPTSSLTKHTYILTDIQGSKQMGRLRSGWIVHNAGTN